MMVPLEKKSEGNEEQATQLLGEEPRGRGAAGSEALGPELVKQHEGGQCSGWNGVGKAGRGSEVISQKAVLEGFEQRKDDLTYFFFFKYTI